MDEHKMPIPENFSAKVIKKGNLIILQNKSNLRFYYLLCLKDLHTFDIKNNTKFLYMAGNHISFMDIEKNSIVSLLFPKNENVFFNLIYTG